jgi:hypothetical protein
MKTFGRPLRRISIGGRNSNGAVSSRHGAATAAAVAALIALLVGAAGCETLARPVPAASAAQARANVRAGLGLYESAEYALAARSFHAGAVQARRAGDRVLAKKAVTAECTSWLRGRQLAELAECAQRLEQIQRRERRSEPGINTLIAFGAIAGERPLPQLRIPNTVQALVRQAAEESPQ